jgi:hypothetical protein
MIVFDLDGTLANCEHRRHFVDRDKAAEKGICYEEVEYTFGGVQNGPWVLSNNPDRLWKPDWTSFYEACEYDEPIEATIYIIQKLSENNNVEIWSDRCESVRKKTEKWMQNHMPGLSFIKLKMRPIGDSTPDDQLKEKWLNELIKNDPNTYDVCGSDLIHRPFPIKMVFDDRPTVVDMYRKHGIFVFNCAQNDEEF